MVRFGCLPNVRTAKVGGLPNTQILPNLEICQIELQYRFYAGGFVHLFMHRLLSMYCNLTNDCIQIIVYP